MKKIALTSLLAVFAVSAASAATSPYVAAHVGYTAPSFSYYENHTHHGEFFNDNFAYDMSIAGGVKADVSPAFAVRGELEYDFVNGFIVNGVSEDYDPATDSVKEEEWTMWLRTNTVLANAYIDFKTVSGLTPYIGAGLGYQWNHAQEDLKFHGLAWQAGAGVAYALCDHLSLDLGYRYLSSIDKDIDEGEVGKLRTAYHQFRLGAAYAF
jgi:opacity protein-like surface antigen